MNKLTWVLFSLYFALFVLLGLVFYHQYLEQFLVSGTQPEAIETRSPVGYIYYSQGNNLFRVNPDLNLDAATGDRIERYQSTGEVFHLDLSPNGSQIAYDSKNNFGFLEIWEVETTNHLASIVATRGQADLADWQDFRMPKYSPLGTKLAFIAAKNENETIFIKDLASGKIDELVIPANWQLSDFSWTKDGQKIIYCTKNQTANGCWSQSLNQTQTEKILTGDVLAITISETAIIYLSQSPEGTNIFRSDLNGKDISALTDLVLPNQVTSFQVDPQGESLVYSVRSQSGSEIYSAKTDGRNRLQLTNDNHSEQPVISANGQKVGYLKRDDGIYISPIDNLASQKITNLGETVRLLIWR